jgi:hypothetical protein
MRLPMGASFAAVASVQRYHEYDGVTGRTRDGVGVGVGVGVGASSTPRTPLTAARCATDTAGAVETAPPSVAVRPVAVGPSLRTPEYPTSGKPSRRADSFAAVVCWWEGIDGDAEPVLPDGELSEVVAVVLELFGVVDAAELV